MGAGGAAIGSSNTSGGDLFLIPGVSTGTGRSHVRIQGLVCGASGTSDNTIVDRIVSGVLPLTNNTNMNVADFAVASNGQLAGGCIDYNIQITDGTNCQIESSRAIFTTTLVGGSYATQILKTPGASIVSTGTLNVSWSMTSTTSTKATIVVNANSTGLTSPTLVMYYTIQNFSAVAMTLY
jgi:hypothetical protein